MGFVCAVVLLPLLGVTAFPCDPGPIALLGGLLFLAYGACSPSLLWLEDIEVVPFRVSVHLLGLGYAVHPLGCMCVALLPQPLLGGLGG